MPFGREHLLHGPGHSGRHHGKSESSQSAASEDGFHYFAMILSMADAANSLVFIRRIFVVLGEYAVAGKLSGKRFSDFRVDVDLTANAGASPTRNSMCVRLTSAGRSWCVQWPQP